MLSKGRLWRLVRSTIIVRVEKEFPAVVAQRLAQSATSPLPQAAILRGSWGCLWWLIRAYVADANLLPRRDALEPPPAQWLEGWPSRRD
ncbi:hypothetical protein [Phenylobacterium sp.]|jgi:hypothetical protein|uniref:hypothetical protein n=1 Tax=Phenylobacterium sp. TaxID=1871053 RepID=UPI002F41E910